MARIQGKLDKAAKCLEYFSTRQWRFLDDNVRMLNQTLSPEDKKEFCFDISKVEWSKYIEDYVLGIRHFIFKENPHSLPAARKQLTKMYWLHQVSRVLLVLLIWRAMMLRSRVARKLWFQMIDILLRIMRMLPFV